MAKRIHIKYAAYHLTTNTKNSYPFFEEDIFCNILIDIIANCQKIKPFELLGFKINPDHVHIILQPTGAFNISQIMQHVKRISSDQVNQIISFSDEENHFEKLKWTKRLRFLNQCYIRKNNYDKVNELPRFQWQKGFDDQLIRSPEQLENTIAYLKKQAEHHDLKENKFLYINPKIPTDIIFIN